MTRKFALEYWRDSDWGVGRLRDVPGISGQGETLDELHENLRDAYQCMVVDSHEPLPSNAVGEELELEVRSGATSSPSWSGRVASSSATAVATTWIES